MIRRATRLAVDDGRAPRLLFWVAALVAIAIRILFVATYPLNDRGGDTSNYASMLLDGTSSLVHAGGYPFFVGLPFRADAVREALGGSPGMRAAILAVQHAIDLLALLFLHRVTRLVYGPITAAIALLLAATNVQSLSATSAFYPEWFQSALLVAALGTLFFAFTARGFGRKLLLYAVATLALTICVLVKFNAAVLAVGVVVAIAADRIRVKEKLLAAAACAVVAAMTVTPYVAFHHYPSTGARALTYDTAWVLLTRMQHVFGNTLDPEAGPHTRRWLALSAVLPRSYEQAGPLLYSHVDAVPRETRAPYRSRYAYLLTAGAEQVDAVRRSSALPEGFSVGLSPIPVAYYLGLPESNALGVRVAFEAIRAHPRPYLQAVLRDGLRALRQWPADAPLLTTNLSRAGAAIEAHGPAGRVRLKQRRDFPNVCCSFSDPVVWWPGVRFFTGLDRWTSSGFWPAVFIGLAVLVQTLRIVLVKRIDLQSGATLVIVLLIGVQLAASVATLEFRWKEARLLMPLVVVLGASAIGWGVAAAVRSRPRLASSH